MNIFYFSDPQVKENVPNPLIPIAFQIVTLKPDVVVCGGDHFDMPSLSYYDKGKKSHRPKTYLKDIRAGNHAMREFWEIIETFWQGYKASDWHFLHGNHEFRRNRALEYADETTIELMEQFPFYLDGWEEHKFLDILKIKGVNFSHYFQNNNSDRPIGTARQMLIKKHESCVAGHMQGFDYAEQITGHRTIQAVIAGSCYMHDESYKAQSNHHWRGTMLMKDVNNGMFEFNRYNIYELDRQTKNYTKKINWQSSLKNSKSR